VTVAIDGGLDQEDLSMTQPTVPGLAPLVCPPLSNAERGARIQEIAALVERERSRYIAAAWRILRDPVEAEDAVQDALASACRKADAFRDASQLGTWIYRIVINASLMRLRSQRRRPEADIEVLPEARLGFEPQHETQVETRQLEGILMGCAGELPRGQRDLLMARYMDETPLRDIARKLGITEGGVKARLHRARAALRVAFFSALGPETASLSAGPARRGESEFLRRAP
jgi:RNA polymerase sigma-70 factor (ECF subfamily)